MSVRDLAALPVQDISQPDEKWLSNYKRPQVFSNVRNAMYRCGYANSQKNCADAGG